MKKILVLLLILLMPLVFGQEVRIYCGDGICGPGETTTSCAVDCSCTCRPKETVFVERTIEQEITEREEQQITFFTREELLEASCGVDGDLDGLICDSNENFLNCPSDCTQPSLDGLLCINQQGCLWREAWFVKVLFVGFIVISIYLMYKNSGKRRSRR